MFNLISIFFQLYCDNQFYLGLILFAVEMI